MKDLYQVLNENTIETKVALIAIFKTLNDENVGAKCSIAHQIIDSLSGINTTNLLNFNGESFLKDYIYKEGSSYKSDSEMLPSRAMIRTLDFSYIADTSTLINNLNKLIAAYEPTNVENTGKAKAYLEELISQAKGLNGDNTFLSVLGLAPLKQVMMSKPLMHLPIFIDFLFKKQEYTEEFNLFNENYFVFQDVLYSTVEQWDLIYNAREMIARITMFPEYINDIDGLVEFSSNLVKAQNEFLTDYQSSNSKLRLKDEVHSSSSEEMGVDRFTIKTTILKEAPTAFKNLPKLQSFLKSNLTDEQRSMVDEEPVTFESNAFDDIYSTCIKFNVDNIIDVLSKDITKFGSLVNLLKAYKQMKTRANLGFMDSNTTEMMIIIRMMLQNKTQKEMDTYFKEHEGRSPFENPEEAFVLLSGTTVLQHAVYKQLLVMQSVDYDVRLICASVISAASGRNILPKTKK